VIVFVFEKSGRISNAFLPVQFVIRICAWHFVFPHHVVLRLSSG
jgi:hypothetical protein